MKKYVEIHLKSDEVIELNSVTEEGNTYDIIMRDLNEKGEYSYNNGFHDIVFKKDEIEKVIQR
ncbi:hypothetical protein CW697_10340 [Macrococcoides caseolyticum]|uniref:hypothetical protein n=1 Tax=Macrococcoides caseolyticum TaxID=69966 RepID=UPI000C32B536|nr:hypothetical protein [Macrococcus caseolyticus]PKE33959.1 hypothetical protein CW668_03995 [Macrococcus caseolyticus]PKF29007.1 hypothetical protein CW697_10340 [Macrococcus caseolyticus]